MDAFGRTNAFSDSSSSIQVHVSLRDLPNTDMMSKTDSFCVIHAYNPFDDSWEQMGKTSVVYDCLSPEYPEAFELTYYFEEKQQMRVEVYDEDKKGSDDLADHKKLGEVTFELGALMAEDGQRMGFGHFAGKEDCLIILQGEELGFCSDFLQFQLEGIDLKNRSMWNFFGDMIKKSDPFFVLKRKLENGSEVEILKSSVQEDTDDPEWPIYEMSIRNACAGNYDIPLVLYLWHHKSSGNHKPMGKVEVTAGELKEQDTVFDVELEDGEKKGQIKVKFAFLYKRPTFVDFLKGGMKLNTMIGIDYTASNRLSHDPKSLHYLDPSGTLNHYQLAMKSILEIVTMYDTDKKIPVYGFGAKSNLHPEEETSMCFPVIGDDFSQDADAEVDGEAGVFEAYTQSLVENKFKFAGPTLFVPILRKAIAKAQENKDKFLNGEADLEYTILMMMTDGEITDFSKTKKVLSEANDIPLSIIIVGIGNEDFSKMDELDGDGPQKLGRDIVQFVPYSKYADGGFYGRLAKDTLAEVPKQLLDWAKQQQPEILPGAPKEAKEI
jgi:hypothetical protein